MRARSLHAVTLGVAVAIFAIATPAPRVAGATASGCSRTSGVTVIVDFTYFHRDIERGCAPGDPATALAAVQAAGFSTAGTTQYGDAFLCRIDNLPSPKDEACAATPPAVRPGRSIRHAQRTRRGPTAPPACSATARLRARSWRSPSATSRSRACSPQLRSALPLLPHRPRPRRLRPAPPLPRSRRRP